jgi:3-hydroxyacyl-[acyl-carrier-protein] dehydratase
MEKTRESVNHHPTPTAHGALETDHPRLGPSPVTPAEDDQSLRDALKRCPASTYEAVCQFRKTANPEHLPAIVLGVIERYVEPALRPKLRKPVDDLRLVEDLGIDSLTMMEIVILAEEVLRIAINNEELCRLRTLGDVKQFIECKVRGLPPPVSARSLPGDLVLE